MAQASARRQAMLRNGPADAAHTYAPERLLGARDRSSAVLECIRCAARDRRGALGRSLRPVEA
eukprot:9125355-Pyramimonas_sp.AAC.1